MNIHSARFVTPSPTHLSPARFPVALCLTLSLSLVFSGCAPSDSETDTADTGNAAETQEVAPESPPGTGAAQVPLSQGLTPPPDAAEMAESPVTKVLPDEPGDPASALDSKIKEFSVNTTDLILKASGKTPKGAPFVFAEALPVADLAEGGFATEPAFEEDFDFGWESSTSDWRRATWMQNKTRMAKDRAVTNEEGHLVLTVKAGDPPRGGSIQSTREFGYGRWVARVRPSSVPGVLNSVFTKDWDDLTTADSNRDGRKAEVDFEFLTYTFGENSGEIHLAVHLINKHPLWHVDIPLDFNPSDAFREWGFDILPDKVIWHVDGKLLYAWEYTDEYYIDEMYEFFFNAWTNQRWIQGPPEQDADYHIDWLKFYPYVGE